MSSLWRTGLFAALAALLFSSALFAQTLTVKAPRGNVRSGPGKTYDVVGRVKKGEKYVVDDRRGEWFKVLLDTGQEGWVFQAAVEVTGGPKARPERESSYGPTERDARRLLERFLDPGADKAALMRSLRPRSEDYRRVYRQPLAGALERLHRRLWDSGRAIAGKPGQTELLVFFAMTDDLIDGARVARMFPGGYRNARPYLKRGVPIVRFKFVRPGKRLGMAYDGLVYVDGRWVFMPKPWRAL